MHVSYGCLVCFAGLTCYNILISPLEPCYKFYLLPEGGEMIKDWLNVNVLKAVFSLLGGRELASCMLVCKQWRDIARDDYLWKCICARRWPSVRKRRSPHTLSYHKLYLTFSKRMGPPPLLPPRLSFDDLEFYIDIWSQDNLIFSEAVKGCILRAGIRNPPSDISDVTWLQLDSAKDGVSFKMMFPVDPRFNIPLEQTLSVSVLVGRRDTNKMACILNGSNVDYIDATAFRALAFDYLNFSPLYPFALDTRAWVSLLFTSIGNDGIFNVFGFEIDFRDAACTEDEVLWLLDMLDWK